MKPIFLLYGLSGFISLAYQVVWFRVFADHFGSTNWTFGLVITNFIGGLAAGSLLSKPVTAWIARITGAAHPLRMYGIIEIFIAATAMLTLALPLISTDLWGAFPYWLDGGIYRPVARYQVAHFAVSIVCVFAPCFLMGVTFPLLCKAFEDNVRFPSSLYGWNTLGACSGVLACEFFLLPRLGHIQTLQWMVAANFGLGLYFLIAPGKERATAAGNPQPDPNDSAGATYTLSAAMACAVVGGLLTGAFEADAFRRLQFLDCRSGVAMSFISFWAILAIFLSSWTIRAVKRFEFGWIKIAYVLALFVFWLVNLCAYPLRDLVNAGDQARVIAALPTDVTGQGVNYQFFHFGYSLTSVLWFTGLFVFPAFYLLSLLLPHLCNAVQAQRRHLGIVYGINTLAFCAGMIGFTLLAPRVNVFYSLTLFQWLFVVLVGYLVSVAAPQPLSAWKSAIAALVVAGVCFWAPSRFDSSYFPADSLAVKHPVRAMKSNGANTTYVVEDPAGDVLFFDSHSMSGCNPPAQQYMRLMAHFPLLANPDPSEALLICFGVGNTAAAIACHETIQRIDIVDLNDQVFATAPEFAKWNGNVSEDDRVRLIHDDGRRFLDTTDRHYDLITSEPPPPMFSGVYRLYSREYYETALTRLKPGGMMTQWLPIGQMPAKATAQAIATFVNTFPYSWLFVGSHTNYILIGSNAPIDLATIERRFNDHEKVTEDLKRFGIVRPVHLFARLVQSGAALRAEYGASPEISDQGNSFSHEFHDPARAANITYDPVAVLAEIEVANLSSGAELREMILHFGRLKSMVLDFPVAALMSVPVGSAGQVALANADWRAIHLLFLDSFRAEQRGSAAAQLVLQRALRIAEDVPYVAKRLATLQMQSQLFTDSLLAWNIVRRVDPRDSTGHFGAGWNLLRLNAVDESIESLQRAIQLDDGGVAAYRSTLGDALASAERWSEAVDAYRQALLLDPNDATARQNLEVCLKKIDP